MGLLVQFGLVERKDYSTIMGCTCRKEKKNKLKTKQKKKKKGEKKGGTRGVQPHFGGRRKQLLGSFWEPRIRSEGREGRARLVEQGSEGRHRKVLPHFLLSHTNFIPSPFPSN